MNAADYIDHTLLKPDAGVEDIIRLCREAKEYHFHSVCVNPSRVSTAAEELKQTGVKICCVVGFPLGASTCETKVFEARDAVRNGAQEIDMVLNIGKLKDGNTDEVRSEIKKVKEAIGECVLKVILETCLLTEEEIVCACRLAKEAGADFVKTSTGFSTGGARAEDVSLMKKTVGAAMGVKASGGIRTPERFREMIQAGADRIGTSSGAAIVGKLS